MALQWEPSNPWLINIGSVRTISVKFFLNSGVTVLYLLFFYLLDFIKYVNISPGNTSKYLLKYVQRMLFPIRVRVWKGERTAISSKVSHKILFLPLKKILLVANIICPVLPSSVLIKIR